MSFNIHNSFIFVVNKVQPKRLPFPCMSRRKKCTKSAPKTSPQIGATWAAPLVPLTPFCWILSPEEPAFFLTHLFPLLWDLGGPEKSSLAFLGRCVFCRSEFLSILLFFTWKKFQMNWFSYFHRKIQIPGDFGDLGTTFWRMPTFLNHKLYVPQSHWKEFRPIITHWVPKKNTAAGSVPSRFWGPRAQLNPTPPVSVPKSEGFPEEGIPASPRRFQERETWNLKLGFMGFLGFP